MAQPTITVQPPTRKQRKGGIRTVADFRTEQRLFTGALPVYDALPCNFAVGSVELCYVDGDQPDKTAAGIASGEGIIPTFGGYMAVECFMGPWDDYAERARDTLDQASDRLVEERISQDLASLATTVTADGTILGVVAALEEDADTDYVGLPVIWVSRDTAARGAAEFAFFPDESHDGRLWTANGTPVLASGVLSDSNIYLTGGITVLQSEINVVQGLNPTVNTSLAIAERAYNAIIDCDYVTVAPLTP